MDGLSRLPSELRALIYQFCLPQPQHILLTGRTQQRRSSPAVFHICQESRSEAERYYTRLPIENGRNALGFPQEPQDAVWTDFSKDTICIEPSDLLRALPNNRQETMMSTIRPAQRLAFEFSAPQNFMQLLDILEPIHQSLDKFPDLREVVLYSGPKKWFDDHTGRVQVRNPPLTDAHDAARILLRLLHMLFGGHAWLDSGAGIPPPLRWQFVCNDEADVFAGPFPEEVRYEYVFRCAETGKFEVQTMDGEQLRRLRRVECKEPRVHELVGAYEGCPEHAKTDVEA